MFESSAYDALEPGSLAPNDSILLDYTTKDIPTNIKELFDLIEYLAFNSGQVVSALKKLTEYPITRPVFKTKEEKLKEVHEEYSKIVKYKPACLNVGFDYNMYGNSITSIYKPFIRFIICKQCGGRQKLIDSDFAYFPSTDKFLLNKCNSCSAKGKEAQVEDLVDRDLKKINIVRWNLKNIDIEYNHFTGKSIYYYTMDELEKRRIKENLRDIVATYPRAILPLAGQDSKTRFRFADNYLYHMKTPNLSGISKVWGFPPPTPALKSFFYQFMLRKANEAVALDYMNHLRVLYPAMSQAENNPLQYINMAVWSDEMSSTIRKWRQDRNFIKLSPHPVGYQAIGGEGRGLLLTNEIREASYDILMTLGIPKELMEGTSSASIGTPVYLRIVENMLLTYMEQLKDWVNWVDSSISKFMGTTEVQVDFVPFRLIDDVQSKSLILNWGQGGEKKKLSDTTVSNLLDIDLKDEEEKILEDELRSYKLNKQVNDKIQELENSLANQAAQAASQASGNSVDYNNQQQTIAQADAMAQQLFQVPYEQRKSQLAALQKEDFIMYSVVTQRLDDLKNSMNRSVIDSAKTASEVEVLPTEKKASKVVIVGGDYPPDIFKLKE